MTTKNGHRVLVSALPYESENTYQFKMYPLISMTLPGISQIPNLIYQTQSLG